MIQPFTTGAIIGFFWGLTGGLILAIGLLKPQQDRIDFKIERLKKDLRNLEMFMEIQEKIK